MTRPFCCYQVQGHLSRSQFLKKMAVAGAFVFQKHILVNTVIESPSATSRISATGIVNICKDFQSGQNFYHLTKSGLVKHYDKKRNCSMKQYLHSSSVLLVFTLNIDLSMDLELVPWSTGNGILYCI